MYDILKQKKLPPYIIKSMTMMTEKLITRASTIQQFQSKVKSGQGGICTVVTKLPISQHINQLS